MYVVSLVDCYTQKGWLETQLNLPMVEGLEPPEEEYIAGPPTSITQYAVPITATDPCNRVYIQDQSMQTSDLELARAEAWAHYGWGAERVKNLLQDRNYGLSIDEVNLAHQALSSLAAYEGLKSGEAELCREALQTCWNGALSPLFPR